MVTQKTLDYLMLFGIFLISIDLASFFMSLRSKSPTNIIHGMNTTPLGIIGIILLVSSYVLTRRRVKEEDSRVMGSES